MNSIDHPAESLEGELRTIPEPSPVVFHYVPNGAVEAAIVEGVPCVAICGENLGTQPVVPGSGRSKGRATLCVVCEATRALLTDGGAR